MTTENTTPDDGESVTEQSAEDVPVSEVSRTVHGVGRVSMEMSGVSEDGADVGVVPIREPTVPEDVTLTFGAGSAIADVSLSEDDAVALIDAIRHALEVEKFER